MVVRYLPYHTISSIRLHQSPAKRGVSALPKPLTIILYPQFPCGRPFIWPADVPLLSLAHCAIVVDFLSSMLGLRRHRQSFSAASCTTVTVVLLLLLAPLLVQGESGGKCTSSSSYFCPNCGGMEVSDCLDCDGFLSTDSRHEICFDRRLFQARNVDERDHENYYRFLWQDLAVCVPSLSLFPF